MTEFVPQKKKKKKEEGIYFDRTIFAAQPIEGRS